MSVINVSSELIENIGSYGHSQAFIRKIRSENVLGTPGQGKKEISLFQLHKELDT